MEITNFVAQHYHNMPYNCHFFACFFLLLFTSCHNKHFPGREEEPKGDSETLPKQCFYLSANIPEEVIAGNGEGAISIGIYRPKECTGADATCSLLVSEGYGVVTNVTEAVFGKEDISADAHIIYNADAINAGESVKIRVSIESVAECGPAYADIALLRPEDEPQRIKGMYRMDGKCFEVTAEIKSAGNTSHYSLSGDGFNLEFDVNGNDIFVSSSEDVEDIASAREKLLLAEGFAHNIYYMSSTITESEKRYNLALCRRGNPTIEYFLAGECEWEDTGNYEFEDGWFLPIIAVNAQLLDPAEHRWPVWMQRNKYKDGLLRVIDPYRGECPLSLVNSAEAGSVMIINATDATAVVVPEQNSAFSCPDIFDFTVRTGTSADSPGFVEADGTIVLPVPLRNFDGNGKEIPYGVSAGKLRRAAFVSQASEP
ncbi:MAG: hypothetical protein K2L84_02685 [Muribaculaceae bacterium]|nr:hypothetical protein [Muribaculaceae bacterium]